MNEVINALKPFVLFLILTNIGRIILSVIFIFLGALLVKYDKSPILFYFGLLIFGTQIVLMFGYMIYNMIKNGI